MKRTSKTIIFFAIISTFLYLSFSQTWASTYDYENHNCMHMSEELEDLIETIPGLNAEIVVGTGYKGHMWIRLSSVDIESTTLIPQPRSLYRGAFPEQEVYRDFDDFARLYLRQP